MNPWSVTSGVIKDRSPLSQSMFFRDCDSYLSRPGSSFVRFGSFKPPCRREVSTVTGLSLGTELPPPCPQRLLGCRRQGNPGEGDWAGQAGALGRWEPSGWPLNMRPVPGDPVPPVTPSGSLGFAPGPSSWHVSRSRYCFLLLSFVFGPDVRTQPSSLHLRPLLLTSPECWKRFAVTRRSAKPNFLSIPAPHPEAGRFRGAGRPEFRSTLLHFSFCILGWGREVGLASQGSPGSRVCKMGMVRPPWAVIVVSSV